MKNVNDMSEPTQRRRSLEGLHGTVSVPPGSAHPWRQYLAFAGPAMLVSAGYMDPGNWSTDLSAGAGFKYGLLFIGSRASLMAIAISTLLMWRQWMLGIIEICF